MLIFYEWGVCEKPFQYNKILILDAGINENSAMLKQEFILIRIFNNYQQAVDKNICCETD